MASLQERVGREKLKEVKIMTEESYKEVDEIAGEGVTLKNTGEDCVFQGASHEIEMLDFVGAIYSELVEMNVALCKFLEAATEEKNSEKQKKELGFKVGADAGACNAKGGVSAVSKIFGNVK